MTKKLVFPLNPNCSKPHISDGKETFIYFYFKVEGKRKQAKFGKGLNEPELTKTERSRRIKKLYSEVLSNLTTKVFNGYSFKDIETNDALLSEARIPNFHEAAKVYIQNRQKFLSEKSISNYRQGIIFFEKYLSSINKSQVTIREINGEMIEDYIIYLKTYVSKRYKSNLSRYTIKEYKERLGAVFNFWYKKRRVLEYNPMTTIQLGYTLKSPKKSVTSVFSVEEFKSIIDYCKTNRRPAYLTFLLMIYYTHLRPIEISRLQLRDIDMGKRKLVLKAHKSKTRIERIVPLDVPIYNHLMSCNIDFNNPELKEKNLFSYDLNKKISYVGDRQFLHRHMTYTFKIMLKELGIDDTLNKYNLKHTANVHEIVYEGMSFAQVQAKNGHVLSSQTEIYLRDLKDYYNNQASEKERVLKFDI